MKKPLLLLSLIIVTQLLVYSQEPIIYGQGISTIGFEQAYEYPYVGIDTQQVWQITEPKKEILFIPEQNLSMGKMAIITDTAFYGNNLNSYFQFKLVIDWADSYEFTFAHKYDFETNKDGGIIETSWDNGETWLNLIYDTIVSCNIFGFNPIYSLEDTISSYNNQPGFTGLQSQVESIGFTFNFTEDMIGDTMLIRFVISSDDNNNNNEGWLLDFFQFAGVTVGVDSHDSDFNNVFIYPNPVNNILHINSNNDKITKVNIITMTGQKIYSESGDAISTIYIPDFPAGLYFIKVGTYKNEEFIVKLCKI